MDPEGAGLTDADRGFTPEDSGDRANAPLVQGIAEDVQSKDTSPVTPEQERVQMLVDKVNAANDELGGELVVNVPMKDGSTTLLFDTVANVAELYGGYDRGLAFGVNSERGMVRLSAEVNKQFVGPGGWGVNAPEGLQLDSQMDLEGVSGVGVENWAKAFDNSKRNILSSETTRGRIAQSRVNDLDRAIGVVSAPIRLEAPAAVPRGAEVAAATPAAAGAGK